MIVLRDPSYDVPGGWTFTVDQTKYTVKGRTFRDLVINVELHYSVNGLDLPDNIGLLVQSQIAKRVPDRMTRKIEL